MDFGAKTKFPKSSKVVFSQHIVSHENPNLKDYTGFAYTFYKRINQDFNKVYFYVPYTFCIISDYPYFNSYLKLFKCIRHLYELKELYIPIEFIIYNIITLTPSPLNFNTILNLKSLFNQDEAFTIYETMSKDLKKIERLK